MILYVRDAVRYQEIHQAVSGVYFFLVYSRSMSKSRGGVAVATDWAIPIPLRPTHSLNEWNRLQGSQGCQFIPRNGVQLDNAEYFLR